MNDSLSVQNEKKLIRFIDSQYNTQFYVEDGKNLILDLGDEQTIIGPCHYIDPYHFSFQNRTWHICEFAEFNERNKNVCRPEQAIIVITDDILALSYDALKLARELDPYEYMDSYDTEEELFNEITQSIANGNVADMIEWYRPIVEEGFKEATEAQCIIDRLQKYAKDSNSKESFDSLLKNTDDRKNMKSSAPREITLPER